MGLGSTRKRKSDPVVETEIRYPRDDNTKGAFISDSLPFPPALSCTIERGNGVMPEGGKSHLYMYQGIC